MQCPSCKSTSFRPAKLEPSLGALECTGCEGMVLDLVSYRLWRERNLMADAGDAPLKSAPDADHPALLCPRCSRIMLRFRYTKDTTHVLDVCSHCDTVWLQAGEWEFLKNLGLHAHVSQIFTDPWQRQLRSERTRDAQSGQWDQRLGAELHEELAELRTRIEGHANRGEILAYLQSADPYAVAGK